MSVQEFESEFVVDEEFQSLIPPPDADERAQLEASLIADGCRDALVVWDEESLLLDGHNRYSLCAAHGIPFRVDRRSFGSRQDATAWVIQNQLARRNLSNYARAELALRMKAVVAAKAKAKQGERTDIRPNLDECSPMRTDETLASAASVSRGTFHKVETIDESAPEPVKNAARKGDLSVDRAYQLTRVLKSVAPEIYEAALRFGLTDPQLIRLLDEKRTSETVQELLASGRIQYNGGDDPRDKALDADATAWDVQGLLRFKEQEYRRREHDARLEAKFAQVATLPEDTFTVIYADPPWQYDNTGLYGAAERHYPTVSTDALCDMLDAIDLQVADDAVLFMWATNPLLTDALRVMSAWGFEYKTNLVWVKDKPTTGLGFYVRGQHELLLVGTRGSFLPNFRYTSLIIDQKAAHSAKPKTLYGMIETMYPNQRYVELFARFADERDGWTFWGNQADAEIQ